jgi:hypothetical protein
MSTSLTLILNALLNPLAKNPPNGPMTEANNDIDIECNMNGYNVIVFHGIPN